MLSESIPSCAATSSATRRIRSRERPVGSVLRRRGNVLCIIRRTQTLSGRPSVAGRSTARALVWGAFAGQALFLAAWITGGAVQPGYSAVSQPVSAFAARDAAHPWIGIVGIALVGVSFATLAVALRLTLPRRRAVPVALFAAVGACYLALAPL